MLVMDVNIVDRSKNRVLAETLFEMDTEEQDVVTDTLDYCMLEMLKWLEEERDPALNIVCNVFEKVVLPTYGIRYRLVSLLFDNKQSCFGLSVYN